MDFHATQGADAPVVRCVLTGPAAGIPGFASALSAELGLPVAPGGVEGAPPGVDPLTVSVAAGLALEEALR